MAYDQTAKKPLRVCILAIGFWPLELGYAGRQPLVYAELLARQSHKVSVVTAFPMDTNSRGSLKHRLIAKEQLNGIEVIRVPTFRPSRPGLTGKLLFYLSFAFTSLMALPFIRKTDVILGLDPPAPFLLLPGFLFSFLLRAKYIVRVTDLWPDVVFDYDLAKSKLAKKVVTLITITAYKLANHIMVFTPDIKPRIMKYGIPDEKITVIEIAIDTSLFHPIPGARKQSAGLGLPNPEASFIILYSGAFALTYDFDTLLDAAKILEGNDSILFVLLGDGDTRDHIKEKIAKLGLENVIMLPPVSQTELVAKYINCSDICVVPLKPEMVTSMITRPAKTFEFWACEKPVIACSNGELPSLMEHSQAGVALEPGQPEALARAIESLYLNRDVTTAMGKRGRQFVLDRFSYPVLATNLTEMISRLCSN